MEPSRLRGLFHSRGSSAADGAGDARRSPLTACQEHRSFVQAAPCARAHPAMWPSAAAQQQWVTDTQPVAGPGNGNGAAAGNGGCVSAPPHHHQGLQAQAQQQRATGSNEHGGCILQPQQQCPSAQPWHSPKAAALEPVCQPLQPTQQQPQQGGSQHSQCSHAQPQQPPQPPLQQHPAGIAQLLQQDPAEPAPHRQQLPPDRIAAVAGTAAVADAQLRERRQADQETQLLEAPSAQQQQPEGNSQQAPALPDDQRSQVSPQPVADWEPPPAPAARRVTRHPLRIKLSEWGLPPGVVQVGAGCRCPGCLPPCRAAGVCTCPALLAPYPLRHLSLGACAACTRGRLRRWSAARRTITWCAGEASGHRRPCPPPCSHAARGAMSRSTARPPAVASRWWRRC